MKKSILLIIFVYVSLLFTASCGVAAPKDGDISYDVPPAKYIIQFTNYLPGENYNVYQDFDTRNTENTIYCDKFSYGDASSLGFTRIKGYWCYVKSYNYTTDKYESFYIFRDKIILVKPVNIWPNSQ